MQRSLGWLFPWGPPAVFMAGGSLPGRAQDDLYIFNLKPYISRNNLSSLQEIIVSPQTHFSGSVSGIKPETHSIHSS